MQVIDITLYSALVVEASNEASDQRPGIHEASKSLPISQGTAFTLAHRPKQLDELDCGRCSNSEQMVAYAEITLQLIAMELIASV